MDDSERLTQAQQEMPMKVYQGQAILKEINAVKELVKGQGNVLQSAVSQPYLADQLKSLEEKLTDRYDPYLAGVRWTAKTAIGAFVSIILMVIAIYLKS